MKLSPAFVIAREKSYVIPHVNKSGLMMNPWGTPYDFTTTLDTFCEY